MAILRCKMCGGDLEIIEGLSSCTCEFCGTVQTIPTVKDEGLKTLFNRANVLRMKSEFDKASEMYEKILQKSESESEAYWGLILCKYGIEYVEDPNTYKRIPTCHRASFDAVTSDEDYKNALKYADAIQRKIYEEEAKAIDEVQKGIIALAQKEDPYDVFICYKETDENGNRTQDSVIANDIYYQLTQEGFKVFYAAITLEDKLGSEYEPHIFSALNTAKVMLSLGTKPEYFNAVWVKNEWSRFLKIMKKDRSKMLIPCYRDMDAYELPEEFSHLQAQDMSKIGFITDLIRGIKKVIVKEKATLATQETVVVQQTTGSTTAIAQIKRGNMALEDQDWAKADSFFEEALNLDPECAEAYVGKLLAREKKVDFTAWVSAQKGKYSDVGTECLEACPVDSDHIEKIVVEYSLLGYLSGDTIRKEYQYNREYDSSLSLRKRQKASQMEEISAERLLTRAKQYAKGDTLQQIEDGIEEIRNILENRISGAKKKDEVNIERIKNGYLEMIADADRRVLELYYDAQKRQEKDYQKALNVINVANSVADYENAERQLHAIFDYKDCAELIKKCQNEINRIKEEERKRREQQAEKERKEAEIAISKRNKMITIIMATIAFCVLLVLLTIKVIIPNVRYNSATSLMAEGRYEEAIDTFKSLGAYRDSTDQMEHCCILLMQSKASDIRVGSTILLGSYEQDGFDNGEEPIEWIVLRVDGNRALVISKYGLDAKPYHEGDATNSWENCNLRQWINEEFLNNAFSEETRKMILETEMKTEIMWESEDTGIVTKDKVFLISKTEGNLYFSSNLDRQCEATAYAVAQGVAINRDGYCRWWLRSPGAKHDNTARITFDGIIGGMGVNVHSKETAIRPAMWIEINN